MKAYAFRLADAFFEWTPFKHWWWERRRAQLTNGSERDAGRKWIPYACRMGTPLSMLDGLACENSLFLTHFLQFSFFLPILELLVVYYATLLAWFKFWFCFLVVSIGIYWWWQVLSEHFQCFSVWSGICLRPYSS